MCRSGPMRVLHFTARLDGIRGVFEFGGNEVVAELGTRRVVANSTELFTTESGRSAFSIIIR